MSYYGSGICSGMPTKQKAYSSGFLFAAHRHPKIEFLLFVTSSHSMVSPVFKPKIYSSKK